MSEFDGESRISIAVVMVVVTVILMMAVIVVIVASPAVPELIGRVFVATRQSYKPDNQQQRGNLLHRESPSVMRAYEGDPYCRARIPVS